ncbi:MAG: hypothetical protein CSA81_07865 [Acidobacteria bacterium]|nr:MAG: hypothetical protein CSA81_07865 [Acidobacteriota bacterium]
MLKKYILRLENQAITPLAYILSVFSIIVIRMILESVVYLDGVIIHPKNFLLHFMFFYLVLFLFLTFVMNFIVREPIGKTSKLLLIFLPVIWSPPIIDFFYGKITGTPISRIFYVKGDFEFLVRQFLTFYSGMDGKLPVVGLKTELLFIIVGMGIVVWIKTQKPWKALLASVLAYVLIFLCGSVPELLINHKAFFNEFQHRSYLDIRRNRAAFFAIILFFQLCFWYWRFDSAKLKSILGNIRPFRVTHYLGMLGFGLYLGFLQYGFPFEMSDVSGWLALILLIIVVFSLWMSSVFLNDISDFEADKLSKPYRPLVQGQLSKHDALHIGVAFSLFSLFFAATLSWTSFALTLACLSISMIYSFDPFRLKRLPFLATLSIAFGSLLVLLIGYASITHGYFVMNQMRSGKLFAGFPSTISLMILLCFTLSFTTKDIADYKGDQATGTWTLPVLLGERAGKLFTGVLVLLSFCLVPFILGIPLLLPFAVLAGALNFYIITRPVINETHVFIVYYLFMSIVGVFVFMDPSVLL